MTDNVENINSNVVDNIVLGNVSKARDVIHDILKSKISGEIEDHKKEFAASIFADDTDTVDDTLEVDTVVDEPEEVETDSVDEPEKEA